MVHRVRHLPAAVVLLGVVTAHRGPRPRPARLPPIPHFVPHLQVKSQTPVSPGSDYVNVTSDLGVNNPSVQFDGSNFHYHFARGDAGWMSAFEVANANHINKIYFPRGTYWFGTSACGPNCSATTIDLAAYPNLYNGKALDIYGDGDYLTHFTHWGPIDDGPMLTLTASTTVATMAWRLHGMYFDACTTSYALAINDPDAAQGAPRAEHNDMHVYDVSVANALENRTCHGTYFPGAPSEGARGAVYFGHMWSSAINVGYATVTTDRGPLLFNDTAGLVLNEVQYSTLSLRGLGTHSAASFSKPDPTQPAWYNGWGLILKANVNSNTIVQLHCEGTGGCVLIDGPGSFENYFTSAVMSMCQRVLIAAHSAPPEPMSVPNYNVFQGIVVNRYPVTDPATGKVHKFSDLVEGDPSQLVVHHMSVIG
eukprot:m.40996 g.40996  ORF g.40996 m.40996 type:complete len:423 (-) comp6058_c0_seq1:90-1358(-)